MTSPRSRDCSASGRQRVAVEGLANRVAFDGPVSMPILMVDPAGDRSPLDGGIRWAGPTTPEVIDELVDIVTGAEVEVTIVIGGLERYPVEEREWPKWLVRWGRHPGAWNMVVRTDGLTMRRRRRLIAATRRRVAATRARDPIAETVGKLRRWITGRKDDESRNHQ